MRWFFLTPPRLRKKGDSDKSPSTFQAFPNSFKRDLLARKRLIGCWASLSNAISTEVLGMAGFDWLLLDGEHSPNDVIKLIRS